MENKITVKLNENINIFISSDSPDLSDLIKKIIEIEDLDIEQITVESTVEDFDVVSFEQAIKVAIKDIKKELVINKDSYEQALKELQTSE